MINQTRIHSENTQLVQSKKYVTQTEDNIKLIERMLKSVKSVGKLITGSVRHNHTMRDCLNARSEEYKSTFETQVEPFSVNETNTAIVRASGVDSRSVNQFLIGKELGSGSFGRVFRAKCTITSNEFACKVISRSRLARKLRFTAKGLASPEAVKSEIRNEIEILKRLPAHPRIIKLHESIDDPNHDNIFLIFSLYPLGAVMTITAGSQCRPFSEHLSVRYIQDVVAGLGFLHSNRVIHHDIKPENIFLCEDDHLVIGDYGVSHFFMAGQNEGLTVNKRTSPAFCAPEMLTGKAKPLDGRALDIWALGVTFYCFLHGRLPFEETEMMPLTGSILKAKFTLRADLSEHMRVLMTKILEKVVTKRIKLAGISKLLCFNPPIPMSSPAFMI